jgi:hypothetical protein
MTATTSAIAVNSVREASALVDLACLVRLLALVGTAVWGLWLGGNWISTTSEQHACRTSANHEVGAANTSSTAWHRAYDACRDRD